MSCSRPPLDGAVSLQNPPDGTRGPNTSPAAPARPSTFFFNQLVFHPALTNIWTAGDEDLIVCFCLLDVVLI